MTRLLSIFEGKETKRARVEAEIVERSERFRASPTVTIGAVTVLNPTYEGPNPFEIPELLDPENAGVLLNPVQREPDPEAAAERSRRRRDRAKSEAYKKTPWGFEDERVDAVRNPRYSAPPMTTVSVPSDEPGYVSDDDPFHKDPLSSSTAAPNSFFMDMEEEKRKARRRTVAYSVDYLQVDIPDNRL
ncbi:hypothetical protein B0H17DRAFT_1057948 [Mycena rosella]|uniref:Uncharacterized protein n=1 Tax=Mycena rosella TaxID=1033263 RepID=A0AAD7GL41_MYCRO|nr:hypothetical protein B0H17DRAFT_1057948 [Mycena rosella]